MCGSSRFVALVVFLLNIVSILPVAQAGTFEVLVHNDSLVGGQSGAIIPGFAAGERAAVWLESPCEGTIVGIQIFWRSVSGVAPAQPEESIQIFDGATFPVPGTLLAEILGPVMNDGVFNEFRFLDENQVLPLAVPIGAGQTFVVSFTFLNGPDPAAGPSVVTDLDGCQAGKNTIDAIGLGWVNACLLGVSGDWAIRAVVECPLVSGSGSVPNGGDTPGAPLRINRLPGDMIELDWQVSCSEADIDYAVYQGFLAIPFYTHSPAVCTTGGNTSVTLSTDSFDRYYLIVPTDGVDEGSYGRDGTGSERPQGVGACKGLQTVSCPIAP